ncbi:MAG: methionine--tRNA ligase [Oligoflexales bacterium]|nr:methionine--tRNA ligase [Oligoflexales bacterium]
MKKIRRMLVTTALPYSNRDLHLGHILEHCITDFWTRFQKMRGNDCLSICADDSHGAPIMVEARKRNIDPEQHITHMKQMHIDDLKAFGVHYDHYSSTHTQTNKDLCDLIYRSLKDEGSIVNRFLKQYYCEKDLMFLPDRFVQGSCPRCDAPAQYGDSCDKCGAVYTPEELKNPQCSMCKGTPVIKSSEHFFVRLSPYKDFLREWVAGHTPPAIANKLLEWLDADLADWCFTRDFPYFGFELPDVKGKFYYVWFDAPIGYIATTKEWCEANNRHFDEFWKSKDCEIYHNIGKDIFYFHSLFWPTMLKAASFTLPKEIWVHGMLTSNGEKLSKSKGTFINAKTYLEYLDPEYLRYYFACKLSSSIDDIDLNFNDFSSRVNSDLVGKITNILSRSAQLLNKKMDSHLGAFNEEGNLLFSHFLDRSEVIAGHYEKRDFAKAMLEIRSLADLANKYADDNAPWREWEKNPEGARTVLTVCINLFRILAMYLKPILPHYVEKVENFLGDSAYTWESLTNKLENRTLRPYLHILSRLDDKKISSLIADSAAIQKLHAE